MRGIILAAGRGKRLLPITNWIAKPLIPVNGVPIIEQVIAKLNYAGIDDITIVVGYKKDQIKNYLGEDFTYVEQEAPLGTAHALKAAMRQIGKGKEDVFVSSADALFPEAHYRRLLDLFMKEDLGAALTLKYLDDDEIIHSSSVEIKNGLVKRVIEKPEKNEILSNIACGPVYIFKGVIEKYLEKVRKSKRGEYELTDAISMMIDDGLKVKGVEAPSWMHLTGRRSLGDAVE